MEPTQVDTPDLGERQMKLTKAIATGAKALADYRADPSRNLVLPPHEHDVAMAEAFINVVRAHLKPVDEWWLNDK
jgi:hypothetical protein